MSVFIVNTLIADTLPWNLRSGVPLLPQETAVTSLARSFAKAPRHVKTNFDDKASSLNKDGSSLDYVQNVVNSTAYISLTDPQPSYLKSVDVPSVQSYTDTSTLFTETHTVTFTASTLPASGEQISFRLLLSEIPATYTYRTVYDTTTAPSKRYAPRASFVSLTDTTQDYYLGNPVASVTFVPVEGETLLYQVTLKSNSDFNFVLGNIYTMYLTFNGKFTKVVEPFTIS